MASASTTNRAVRRDAKRALRLTVALLIGMHGVVHAAESIDVKVEKHGETVVVDVRATVAVRRAVAWAVLTDYDHMTRFVSALTSSAITARKGNTLEVSQTGEARLGFVHFGFASVRSVQLVDEKEIRSHLIRGDFKSYDFKTAVADEGVDTVITHHGEYVPTSWVPPGVGVSLIRSQTEKQYAEMTAEMHRRQAAEKPPA